MGMILAMWKKALQMHLELEAAVISATDKDMGRYELMALICSGMVIVPEWRWSWQKRWESAAALSSAVVVMGCMQTCESSAGVNQHQ